MIVDMYDGKNDLTRQVADWKARAEAAEARVSWLEEQISHYKEDLRVQKASHEARVRELEAQISVQGMDAATLGKAIYNDMGTPWRDRALHLQNRVEKLEQVIVDHASKRLAVTDEMVERAKLEIVNLRGAEVGGCFRPENIPQGECVDGDCYCNRQAETEARTALTAALENRHD